MPGNDCRPTLRYLKSAKVTIATTEDFSVLPERDTVIRQFVERRQDDPDGGEKGERVQQIRTKPCFKLTSGRYRGATWFDREHPPQEIVWLLGMEWHDERDKGRRDAYDILGQLDERGELFPQPLDYKRLELDRRRRDTQNFAPEAQKDAEALVNELLEASTNVTRDIAGIRVIGAKQLEDGLWFAYFTVSDTPVTGKLSGLPFPLTSQRFDLVRAAIVQAFEKELASEVLSDTSHAVVYPLSLPVGRRFFVMFDR